jgi:hypothetical protein
MIKPVAIIGCDIHGLLAAQAMSFTGRPLAIFDTTTDHSVNIPMISTHPVAGTHQEKAKGDEFTFRFTGTKNGYLHKRRMVSPSNAFFGLQNFSAFETFIGYDLEKAYVELQDKFLPNVNILPAITPQWVDDIRNDFADIITSFPAQPLCRQPDLHGFSAIVEMMYQSDPNEMLPNNSIVLNGQSDIAWHCGWNTNGAARRIYERDRQPPVSNMLLTHVATPIRSNCDCNSFLFKVGPMANWSGNLEVDDAFWSTVRKFINADANKLTIGH